jgi:hypothetical protein
VKSYHDKASKYDHKAPSSHTPSPSYSDPASSYGPAAYDPSYDSYGAWARAIIRKCC